MCRKSNVVQVRQLKIAMTQKKLCSFSYSIQIKITFPYKSKIRLINLFEKAGESGGKTDVKSTIYILLLGKSRNDFIIKL